MKPLDTLFLILKVAFALFCATADGAICPGDLQYQGYHELKNLGFTVESLAYRPDTNTYFTIRDNSYAPFKLTEFKFVGLGQPVQIVKEWGAINDANDRLNLGSAALPKLTSLVWDESRQGLWCSYGSWYVLSNAVNAECLCFVKPTANGLEFFGPWSVPRSLIGHIRGNVLLSGDRLQTGTGYDLFAASVRNPGNPDKSWGIGACLFNRPSLTAPGSLTIRQVSDWPMLVAPGGTPGKYFYFSEFPRGPEIKTTWIAGNNDCNPPTKPTYQTNTFYPITDKFSMCDCIRSVAIVDGTILYFGSVAEGYAWYGNANSHSDPASADNNLMSLLDPTKPLKSSTTSRGYLAEKVRPRVWMVGVDTVSVASLTVAGTSKVPPAKVVDLADLGGSADWPTTDVSQAHYHGQTRMLYVLFQGTTGKPPRVLVWEVK